MKDLRPILCMERDKDTLDFCMNKISIAEPCSVIEVNGYGARVIYFEILEKIKSNFKDRILNYCNAKNSEELRHFLLKIKEERHSQVVVVYLTTNEDCSWFVKELEGLRDKRNIEFVSVVFSRVGDVFQSLLDKQKILFRSMKVLEPIDFGDVKTLINDFNRRFDFKPSDSQTLEIFKLSGGHVGMIKSLFLFLKDNHQSLLDNKVVLLKEPSISSRLEGSIQGLPEKLVVDLLHYPESKYLKKFIENFNFVKKGRLVSPLLKKYLEEKFKEESSTHNGIEEEVDTSLTVVEKNLFNSLIISAGKIADREEVAKIIWGSNWEEQYSDWAIDQTIHRLREKLKKAKAPYKILTKKGRGFILQEK